MKLSFFTRAYLLAIHGDTCAVFRRIGTFGVLWIPDRFSPEAKVISEKQLPAYNEYVKESICMNKPDGVCRAVKQAD
ncbi:MAG: hypothetical protein D6800_05980 [Candidatus Zixiibacteriota bacterium]|nr:MAG: hypothetical protein D6800_05980 [candidate division Zixibacteria bacterium]